MFGFNLGAMKFGVLQKEELKLMAFAKENSKNYFQGRKILWIYPFMLDAALHKTDFLEILNSLRERGNSVCLIAIRSREVGSYHENSRIRIISIPLRYLPVVSPAMFAIVLFLFLPACIIDFKPNFIVTQPDPSILSFIPAFPFSKFKSTKFILDVRSTPVETGGFRGFLQNLLFTPSIILAKKSFDGLTIISPLMKREVCERFHINPDKVGVWASGVSPTLFNPKSYLSEAVALKRKLGLSRNFVVFYHGVFTANRGLTETIEAVKILKEAIPDLVFFLLGTGPIVPMLADLIGREKLQGRVIIHDAVDHREVPKYIAMSDVCIIPLPNHPFWRFQCPLKLLEYLAMEKVVIATDIPAHRVIIGKEKCGIYVQSAEPTKLAESIVYAYNNKENLKEWGKSGRRIITHRYTWEKVAEDLESYLLSVYST